MCKIDGVCTGSVVCFSTNRFDSVRSGTQKHYFGNSSWSGIDYETANNKAAADSKV